MGEQAIYTSSDTGCWPAFVAIGLVTVVLAVIFLVAVIA